MARILGSCLLVSIATAANAASFIPGDLAVLQVGDGGAALSSTSTALFIREFTPLGSLVQTFNIPTSGGSETTLSGSATSEGALTLSTDGHLLTYGAYATGPGVASIASTAATAINRSVGVLNGSGVYSRVAVGSNLMFDANNPRGAVSDGQNFWLSGTGIGTGSANGGIWYSANGGTPTQIRNGNLRVANIFNGSLYFSSSASTPGVGIHGFTGIPTSTATSSQLFTSTGGSPVDFAISPSGTFAYVADDRSAASGGGIQRWNFNGSSWSLAYTLAPGTTANDGVRQIAVDFNSPTPLIYGTTTESSANRLVEVADGGAGSAFSLLATAGANTAFRGVDFAPTAVPEPSLFGLMGLGAVFAAGIRKLARRK
jgi:hypothetical protein